MGRFSAGAQPRCAFLLGNLEAPPGIEPGMEVLQTSALPLGDGAPGVHDGERETRRADAQRYLQQEQRRIAFIKLVIKKAPVEVTPRRSMRPRGVPSTLHVARERSGRRSARVVKRASRGAGAPGDKNWSGKGDSNPRLRPWQGRTLPLSYSRPARPLTLHKQDRTRQQRRVPG